MNKSYVNKYYVKDDPSSWKKLVGSDEGKSFRAQEWEVWELRFRGLD